MPAMDLLTFIADGDRKARLAAATGRSEGYLWQIATGWRGKRPSPELALDIERVSRELVDQDLAIEAVGKESLRPDLWPPADIAGVGEQQGDHLAGPLVSDVEAANGGEAQGRPNVHAVKAASPDARAA
jgi:hypothetical protein